MHRLATPRRAPVALLVLLLLAVSLPAAPVIAAESVPRFEATRCPFKLADGQVDGQNVTCGYVTVPEVHAKPGGTTIRLRIAWFKSTSPTPAAEPIIYLEGGPGGPALSDDLPAFAAQFTETHDFVTFDQRGVGASRPSLTCPELGEVGADDYAQNIDLNTSEGRRVAAMYACRDRLAAAGVNLGAYTTAESAGDVNDIRAVLGYKKVKLLGISYGTRLGLTVMQRFPQIVTSAVLDSVSPPQVDQYALYTPTFDRTLGLMFTNCAADAACNGAFPTLKADFSQVIAKLDAAPMTVTIPSLNQPIVLNSWRFVGLIHELAYDASDSRYLPLLITQIKNGDTSLITRIFRSFYDEGPSSSAGMAYSVRCSEYTPFSTQEAAAAAARDVLPEIRATFLPTIFTAFTICAQWPIAPLDPTAHQPVSSAIPTLVLESGNDPVTPPSNGQLTVQTLSRAIYVESPGIGHSVIGNGGTCANGIVRAFYAAPTTKPDTACLATLGIKYRTGASE